MTNSVRLVTQIIGYRVDMPGTTSTKFAQGDDIAQVIKGNNIRSKE